MIQGKKVLAVVPARGGSKGLPGKNVRPLLGKPLIQWTHEASSASRYVDRTILSTDDPSIATLAKGFGMDVPFLRPTHLADDAAKSSDMILHALDACPDFDFVVMLQPTSPLRTAEHIDECLEKAVALPAPAVVSVREVAEHPSWMYWLGTGSALRPVLAGDSAHRRQDLPDAYFLNGAVYVADVSWFRVHKTFLSNQTAGYVMPESCSVDIDNLSDFTRAELLLKGRHER